LRWQLMPAPHADGGHCAPSHTWLTPREVRTRGATQATGGHDGAWHVSQSGAQTGRSIATCCWSGPRTVTNCDEQLLLAQKLALAVGETRISKVTEAPAQGLGAQVPGTGQGPVPLLAPEAPTPLDAEPETAVPLAADPERAPDAKSPLLAEPEAPLPLVLPETPASPELVEAAIPPQPVSTP
jgi:hypothetical protein